MKHTARKPTQTPASQRVSTDNMQRASVTKVSQETGVDLARTPKEPRLDAREATKQQRAGI